MTTLQDETRGGKSRFSKRQLQRRYGGPRLSFTVEEFCAAHQIGTAFYYKLKNAGRGPVEMKVGRRRMISIEAAAAWRRAGEAAAS